MCRPRTGTGAAGPDRGCLPRRREGARDHAPPAAAGLLAGPMATWGRNAIASRCVRAGVRTHGARQVDRDGAGRESVQRARGGLPCIAHRGRDGSAPGRRRVCAGGRGWDGWCTAADTPRDSPPVRGVYDDSRGAPAVRAESAARDGRTRRRDAARHRASHATGTCPGACRRWSGRPADGSPGSSRDCLRANRGAAPFITRHKRRVNQRHGPPSPGPIPSSGSALACRAPAPFPAPLAPGGARHDPADLSPLT